MFLDRYKELYQWSLESCKTRGNFHGLQFVNYDANFERRNFGVRTLVSSIWTPLLLIYGESVNFCEVVRMSTLEEDSQKLIDFINGENGVEQAAQFKIRKNDRVDFPCVRYQPCYGLDDPDTLDGRDYRCLRDHTTMYHYAAIREGNLFSKVHRVDSAEFWELVQKLDADWGRTDLTGLRPPKWVREDDGAEVWRQKKEENFHSLHTWEIPKDLAKGLEKMYRRAWDWTVQTFIEN